MTPFLDDVAAKFLAGLACASVLGFLGFFWSKLKSFYAECARLRNGILVVLDERRDVLYQKTKDADKASNLTPRQAEDLFRAIVLKSRMDISRDQLWKDAGCPKPKGPE